MDYSIHSHKARGRKRFVGFPNTVKHHSVVFSVVSWVLYHHFYPHVTHSNLQRLFIYRTRAPGTAWRHADSCQHLVTIREKTSGRLRYLGAFNSRWWDKELLSLCKYNIWYCTENVKTCAEHTEFNWMKSARFSALSARNNGNRPQS